MADVPDSSAPGSDDEVGSEVGSDVGTLLQLVGAGWTVQVVRAAYELELADHLGAAPLDATELAERTGTHAPSVERLLRAMATLGLCTEDDDGRYAITPTGSLLRHDDPSLGAWAMWWGTELWADWGDLVESVRTGESARSRRRQSSGFEQFDTDPVLAARFHEALAALTRVEAAGLLDAYDFRGTGHVVDVGGGTCELAMALLELDAELEATVLDRPDAIELARPRVEARGLADRCRLVAGDFFTDVPSGGDLYVLKSVLHDWDDHAAIALLSRCRDAMDDDGRLLVIDNVMPESLDTSAPAQSLARSDLTMLVAQGGHERTEPQFRALLAEAGFVVRRVVPTSGTLHLIESARVG